MGVRRAWGIVFSLVCFVRMFVLFCRLFGGFLDVFVFSFEVLFLGCVWWGVMGWGAELLEEACMVFELGFVVLVLHDIFFFGDAEEKVAEATEESVGEEIGDEVSGEEEMAEG